MLIRCESCQKLYPKHHGACRNCASGSTTTGSATVTRSSKPSLSERLNASGPALKPKSTDDLKSRIQAKFNKESEPVSTSVPSPVASQAEEPSQNMSLELEETEIPNQSSSEKDGTQAYTIEDGGVCPNCGSYNMAGAVFCLSCETMLTKSEVKVEIVTSYPLKDIKGSVDAFIDKLAKYKVKTTEDMLRVGCNRQNRIMLAKNTGMSERSLLRFVHLSDLCRIPSMKPDQVAMLEMIAINSMAELLSTKSKDIMNKLQQNRMQINRAGIMFFPTRNQVKAWILEARELEPLKIQP